jgi:hypothetical protein
LASDTQVWLITVHDKDEAADLSQAERRALKTAIDEELRYAGLGDLHAVLGWLETACRLRCDMVWLTTAFPGIDPLRSDPRFADLVRRTGSIGDYTG